jgi:hypothetical protein
MRCYLQKCAKEITISENIASLFSDIIT